jgi:uncharacterized protein (DUF4213/DUF364 family)
MSLVDDLIAQVPEGEIERIRVGLHWTAVVVIQGGKRRCGLASTLSEPHKRGEPSVPEAGELTRYTGRELIKLAFEEEKPVLSSVGVATLNALLPDPRPERIVEEQAESLLARYGANRTVALIGHFPFVSRLRRKVGKLQVLELRPRQGDLPADRASDVLPQADVVAITSMALINHTLEPLLELCAPDALVVVLGPSTPMSPVLFEYGVDILAGSQIIDIEEVLRTVCQGGNFRQVHRAGVKLIAHQREGVEEVKVMEQF